MDAIANYKGNILHLHGTPFVLSEDDSKKFGDESYRWLDACYLATDASGRWLHLGTRNPERTCLIDLYFQIKFPHTITSSYP